MSALLYPTVDVLYFIFIIPGLPVAVGPWCEAPFPKF